MTLSTHIIAGLIVGKVTGNYSLAIASSVLVDIDHLQSYIKSRVILKPKLFWKTITDQSDPYGNQRGYLHNLLIFIFISAVLYIIFKNSVIPLILGWGGHLLLDALDGSDYWPFYPYKKINLKGPIMYASRYEIIFSIFLLSVYFFI